MTESLDQGLLLMVLGMGTVFGFLSLLVCVVSIMSWCLAERPGAESAAPTDPSAASLSKAESEDPELISAIIAAVHRYRGDRN